MPAMTACAVSQGGGVSHENDDDDDEHQLEVLPPHALLQLRRRLLELKRLLVQRVRFVDEQFNLFAPLEDAL